MESNLRPLTLGEILDRTAQLYRSNFALFAGISAILAGFVFVVSLVMIGITSALHMTPFALVQSWWYRIAGWVSFLAMMVIGQVTTAANNRAVAWVYLGEPATIVTAYRSILAKLGRYCWIGTVKLAVAWSPVFLLYGALQACYIYFQESGVLPKPGQAPSHGSMPGAGMMYFVAVSGAFFLLIWPALIYGFFIALRYALAVPASVVEGLTTRQALRRSIDLTKGSRGRILALWAITTVIATIAIVVTQSFFFAYTMKHNFDLPWWLRIAQQLISFATSTFVGPILAIGTSLFYFDQRVRKEGYDIEWMMQAAGMVQDTLPDQIPAAPADAPARTLAEAEAGSTHE